MKTGLIEQREARLWGCGDRISGQADLIYLYGKRALILDAKFGRGEVAPAASNEQLRGLAVLVKEGWPELEQITVGILQPWASPQMTLHTYSLEDLLVARAHVLHILDAADAEDAPRRPSSSACQWCKAKPTCPEAQETALALVRMDEPMLPAERLPELLDLAKQAEAALAARVDLIRARARELLAEDAAAIEGWELKKGRNIRSVIDAAQAFEILASAGLVDDVAMMKATKISLPTLEKQVAAFSDIKPSEAKGYIAEALGALIETKTGAPVLAKMKGKK